MPVVRRAPPACISGILEKTNPAVERFDVIGFDATKINSNVQLIKQPPINPDNIDIITQQYLN